MSSRQRIKCLSLTFFFLLLFHPSFSQSRYTDYSKAEKIGVLREDFNASSISWEGYESGRRSTRLEDGQLIFTSFNDASQVKYKTISIDWTSDWEIEYAVKWISGKENSAMDLIWDKESGNDNKFHFGFTANRKHVLAEYKDNAYEHILKFVLSDNLYRSARNIMTVRKVGQTYYFFVNKTLIKTLPYKDVKGDLIGFTVPPNTSIAVDYLYVSQLKQNQVTNTVAGTSKSYNSYTSNNMTEVYREDFSKPDSEWEVFRSGVRMGKIHDGVLDWISMNNDAQLISHTLEEMDWNRDWQVEVRMKHLIGKANSSNDLLFDIQEDNEKYHFGFTAQGKYVLSKYVSGAYESIIPFTSSSTVNKDLFNTFTVRKVGSQYHFYINEELIATKNGLTVSNNKIGFMVPPNSTLQVDYLDVSYLEPKSSTIASSTLPTGMNYVGIMTKYSGYNLQRWKTRGTFPKDEIKSDWDDGYYVSDLSYDNAKWSLVTSKGTGYSNQTWFTRNEWPKGDIKEKWNDGYHITELNYGNGVWAFVFSKNSGYTRQRWATTTTFPNAKIDEFVKDDLWITEIAYGVDRWALVGSKDATIKDQKWFKKAEFPESELKGHQASGYSVTQLSRENNWWVLILSKHTTNRPQELITSSTFPKDQIRDYWDRSYYLTDITYGTTNVEIGYTSNRTETTNPNSKISELLVGKWYGGGVNDTEGEKGYMIFDSSRYATMISEGDTIGGKGWVTDGVAIDLKYEILSSTSPQGIDLVFQSAGQNFGNMKGIIRMVDEDTFEFCLASELTDPRPTAFEDAGSVKLAVFKRVN